MLNVQGNLASTYYELGRLEEALSMERDVYSGRLRLHGEQHVGTCLAAENYAISLVDLQRYAEAKSVLSKTIPVVQCALGESNATTLKMRWLYARVLYEDDGATLDDLREAVTTLEETERTARRVLGGAHPYTTGIEYTLQHVRAARDAHNTPPPPPLGAA